MELVDVVTDVPEFDAVWLDYCKYWNATAATCVFQGADPPSLLTIGLCSQIARYGISFKTTAFNQVGLSK